MVDSPPPALRATPSRKGRWFDFRSPRPLREGVARHAPGAGCDSCAYLFQNCKLRSTLIALICTLFHADTEVIPRRLACDWIAVGVAISAFTFREKITDQVIEQESFFAFRGVGIKTPRAFAFADGVPCPDCVFILAVHEFGLAFDDAVMAGDGDPIAVCYA